jgi:ADP-ribose pyrophosphatase YjhB (NUDIX family)
MTNSKRYEGINFCVRCGHKLSLQNDREGKIRPICEKCGWVYYKNPVPAAACVVFNEKNQLLIIKRKFEPSAGAWALPSGYIEIDQTPSETSVEELLEETGLVGKVKNFLGYSVGSSSVYESIISFGFLLEKTGGNLVAGDDATDAKFVDLHDLPDIPFEAHKYFINQALNIKNMETKYKNVKWRG